MDKVELIPVFSAREIQDRIESLSSLISDEYTGNLTLVGLLDGCYMFLADLARAIHSKGVNVRIGFMSLSSYGSGTESSGRIIMNMDLSVDITGYDVLIVDDIIDSGRTLQYATDYLKKKNPTSIKSCVLLDKPAARKVTFSPDYCGFAIENFFVVGYGLDYDGNYRELPEIYKISV